MDPENVLDLLELDASPPTAEEPELAPETLQALDPLHCPTTPTIARSPSAPLLPLDVLKRLLSSTGLPTHRFLSPIAKLNHPHLSEFLLKLDRILYPVEEATEDILILKGQIAGLKQKMAEHTQDARTTIQTLEENNRQLLELNREHLAMVESLNQQQTAHASQIEALTKELQESKEQIQSLKRESTNLKANVADLDSEKARLLSLVGTGHEEIQLLNEDISRLRDQLKATREETVQLSTKNAELEGNELSRRHLLETREQELAQSQKHSAWLTQELNQKSEEYRAFRHEKAEQLSQLQSQLANALQDYHFMKNRCDSLQQKHEELHTKLTNSIEKTEKAETNLVSAEQQFKAEMLAQKKLSDLYSSKCDDLTEKNEELEDLVRQLEIAMEELKQSNSQMEEETQQALQDAQKTLQLKDEEIAKLKEEVSTLTELIGQRNVTDQLGHLSQTAMAASKLQKSGKSFTEVYAEYTQLQEQVIREKRESAKLKECLDQILSELNQKAPYIQQLQDENELLRADFERLSEDLSAKVKEFDSCERALREANARILVLEEENRAILLDAADLSRQVQTLLGELETAKGNVPALTSYSYSAQQVPESQADAIISERLVVFKNIQELQVQNQQLRRSLRTVSKKYDDLEKKAKEEKAELQLKEINAAKQMIQDLTEQLKMQTMKCESFVRERDQWKRIAEGRPSPSLPKQDITEYQTLYKQLQSDYDAFRKEIGVDGKLLREQLERLQHEKSDLAIQVAKLNTQLDFQQERYQLLIQNNDVQNRENGQLRERMAVLTDTLTKQDSRSQEMNSQWMEAKDEVERVKSEVRQLRAEREVLKNSESRLVAENKALVVEKVRFQDMQKEMQRLYEDHDRENKDQKKKLEELLDRQDKDLQLARKHVLDVQDELKTLSARREVELKEAQNKIEKLNASLVSTMEELSNVKTQQVTMKQKIAELTHLLTTANEKLTIYETRVEGQSNQEVITQLEIQLANAKSQVEFLKEDLRLEQERVQTYLGIAKANEEQLKNLHESSDQYKEKMDLELATQQSLIDSLERKAQELQEQLEKAAQEVTELQERSDQERASWDAEKVSMEERMASAIRREEMVLKSQQSLKNDIGRQAQIALEAQANYEREVVAHSKIIQELNHYKEQHRQLIAKEHEWQQKAKGLEEHLVHEQHLWNEQRRSIETELTDLKERLESVTEQNNVLHSHLEKMSPSQEESAEPSDRTTEELREVIRYMRREKDILQTRYDLLSQEDERIKLQASMLQKSLDETRSLLNEERKRSEESMDYEKKHAEWVDKMNQLNLLRESNVTLREQAEQYAKTNDQLKKKLIRIESELVPLKVKLRETEAELDTRMGEIKTLEEDNQRWKSRTQQILAKYERIDPVVHQKLIDDNAALTTTVAGLESSIEELKKQIQSMENKENEMADERKKLTDKNQKFKALLEQKDALLKEKEEELKNVSSVASSETLKTLTAERDALLVEKENLVRRNKGNIETFKKNSALMVGKMQKLEGQIKELQEKKPSPVDEERIRKEVDTRWTLKYAVIEKQSTQLKAENADLEKKIQALSAEMEELKKKELVVDTSIKRVREEEKTPTAAASAKKVRIEEPVVEVIPETVTQEPQVVQEDNVAVQEELTQEEPLQEHDPSQEPTTEEFFEEEPVEDEEEEEDHDMDENQELEEELEEEEMEEPVDETEFHSEEEEEPEAPAKPIDMTDYVIVTEKEAEEAAAVFTEKVDSSTLAEETELQQEIEAESSMPQSPLLEKPETFESTEVEEPVYEESDFVAEEEKEVKSSSVSSPVIKASTTQEEPKDLKTNLAALESKTDLLKRKIAEMTAAGTKKQTLKPVETQVTVETKPSGRISPILPPTTTKASPDAAVATVKGRGRLLLRGQAAESTPTPPRPKPTPINFPEEKPQRIIGTTRGASIAGSSVVGRGAATGTARIAQAAKRGTMRRKRGGAPGPGRGNSSA